MKAIQGSVIAGLLITSVTANAEGWTAPGRIVELWAQASDSIAVKLDIPMVYEEGCTYTGYYRLREENASGYKTIVAVLLAAQAQDKSVRLHISGCTGPADYPKITNVKVIS